MKLTPWFPAKVKPARRGWYQANYMGYGTYWRYWSGKRWAFSHGPDSCHGQIPESIDYGLCVFGDVAGDKWRGLATKDGK